MLRVHSGELSMLRSLGPFDRTDGCSCGEPWNWTVMWLSVPVAEMLESEMPCRAYQRIDQVLS